MELVTNAINTVKNEQSYKLMNKAIQIENKLANRAEQKHNPARYAKETKAEKQNAWLSANDTFNNIRNDYELKSHHEAVVNAKFMLQTSNNTDNIFYAKHDLKQLLHSDNGDAEYVTYNWSGDIVPASYNNDIIPFIRVIQKHNPAFRMIDTSQFE